MASMATAAFSSAITTSSSRELASFSGLKSTNGAAPFSGQQVASLASKGAVSNGSRVHCMLVWTPYDNKKFETLSYLPKLSDEQVAKQVDYITRKGWIPCLEFSNAGSVYREHFHGSGYYDGRYWTMWKLPMFGCTDASLVLNEIQECRKAYPKAFIRVLGFDRKRQVQVSGFLVHKP